MNKEQYNAIATLQASVGAANAAKGFRVDLNALDADALRNYQITKLALIMTEGAEAIEELRVGRGVTETYYTLDSTGDEAPRLDPQGNPRKPEGVPSEVIDIIIRCLDFCDEFKIVSAAMLDEKLGYNATRATRHGKKV